MLARMRGSATMTATAHERPFQVGDIVDVVPGTLLPRRHCARRRRRIVLIDAVAPGWITVLFGLQRPLLLLPSQLRKIPRPAEVAKGGSRERAVDH